MRRKFLSFGSDRWHRPETGGKQEEPNEHTEPSRSSEKRQQELILGSRLECKSKTKIEDLNIGQKIDADKRECDPTLTELTGAEPKT
jgi:hypothetical protein